MKKRTLEVCKLCGGVYYAKGLCKYHYERQKHGRSQDMPHLTRKNDYKIIGDVAIFTYYDKRHLPCGEFKVDKECVDKIKEFKWSAISTGYIATYIDGKTILLHRFLTDCPAGYVVDHINHDTMDNRICNLRVCTQRENLLNQKAKTNTGLYGISKSKAGYYNIYVCGKYCGCSKDLEKAIAIRNEHIKGTEAEKLNYYL